MCFELFCLFGQGKKIKKPTVLAAQLIEFMLANTTLADPQHYHQRQTSLPIRFIQATVCRHNTQSPKCVLQEPVLQELTHTIHVWYIYLHLA